MLLPIVPNESDPLVQKVKWLISHNADGTQTKYRFKDVGTGLWPGDADVIYTFRLDNNLTPARVIDEELLKFLGIEEFDGIYDEEEEWQPFVLGNKWQLAVSIACLIAAIMFFVL